MRKSIKGLAEGYNKEKGLKKKHQNHTRILCCWSELQILGNTTVIIITTSHPSNLLASRGGGRDAKSNDGKMQWSSLIILGPRVEWTHDINELIFTDEQYGLCQFHPLAS